MFNCIGLVCPQVYFRTNVKNSIIKLKTAGYTVLCGCWVFANLKLRWWPRAPMASHQAPSRQSSQVSAGRQQVSNTMGTAIAAAACWLRPVPGWSFSDPVQGFKLDPVWCWTRAEESCLQSTSLWHHCCLLFPHSCQTQRGGNTESFIARAHTLDWK